MILFVFEGEKTEPQLYSSMKHLFLPKERDDIICSYKSNIYSLYEKMNKSGYFSNTKEDISIVSLLQELLRSRGDFDHPLLKVTNRSKISEVFLFFDYDCQNKKKDGTYSLEENNNRIKKLLDFFRDETEEGKLYINYPMVESIRFTKKLPDRNFCTYEVPLSECPDKIFKNKVQMFSDYGSFDFLTVEFLDAFSKVLLLSDAKEKRLQIRRLWERRKERKRNWKILIRQNIEKFFMLTDTDAAGIQNGLAIPPIRIVYCTITKICFTQ